MHTMKAVILADGLGSRISEESQVKPKPMNEMRIFVSSAMALAEGRFV